MLKLSQTKQYQKDIKKFQQGIAKLTKPRLKTEYEQILKDFIHQCTLIDNAHSSEYHRRIKPVNVRENVIELARLRKKLKDFLN